MQRWVLENEASLASTGTGTVAQPPKKGGKKKKGNKKKKGRMGARTRLWDISEKDVLKADRHATELSAPKYW